MCVLGDDVAGAGAQLGVAQRGDRFERGVASGPISPAAAASWRTRSVYPEAASDRAPVLMTSQCTSSAVAAARE